MNRSNSFLAVALCVLSFSSIPHAQASSDLECHLQYRLSGWSLIYKHTTGTGTVTCSNGQSMSVRITAKALGLTAGKWRIDDGKGRFGGVHSINDVLGNYAQASANAGAVKSAEAQVLTKGSVQLSLSGKGEGVNVGVDIGAFTIKRR